MRGANFARRNPYTFNNALQQCGGSKHGNSGKNLTFMPRARTAKKRGARRGGSEKLTRAEVYDRMRRKVYPPCKKSPSTIRMGDEIESDLGYVGNAKRALAAKTNQEFGLVPPNYLTPQEMEQFTYIREHVAATCEKLLAAGRLEE